MCVGSSPEKSCPVDYCSVDTPSGTLAQWSSDKVDTSLMTKTSINVINTFFYKSIIFNSIIFNHNLNMHVTSSYTPPLYLCKPKYMPLINCPHYHLTTGQLYIGHLFAGQLTTGQLSADIIARPLGNCVPWETVHIPIEAPFRMACLTCRSYLWEWSVLPVGLVWFTCKKGLLPVELAGVTHKDDLSYLQEWSALAIWLISLTCRSGHPLPQQVPPSSSLLAVQPSHCTTTPSAHSRLQLIVLTSPAVTHTKTRVSKVASSVTLYSFHTSHHQAASSPDHIHPLEANDCVPVETDSIQHKIFSVLSAVYRDMIKGHAIIIPRSDGVVGLMNHCTVTLRWLSECWI